jgi:hypothetical protein
LRDQRQTACYDTTSALKAKNRRVKYWEIIADNLSKAGWSWGCVSAVGCNGQTSGLLTRIATMESIWLCGPMKADCVC